MIGQLNRVIRGTANYFATPWSHCIDVYRSLDRWIRMRLRCMKFKWKSGKEKRTSVFPRFPAWKRCFVDLEPLEEERRLLCVALTRAADRVYVYHAQRESSSCGSQWLVDAYERRELTRSVTKPVEQTFHSQQAGRFEEPGDTKAPKNRQRRSRKKAPQEARG